ncbi:MULTISPECIES: hypothetical protein [unclassified Raoultella]|uniref:hypothetical protein n=1 Tax=unclassified Raoultella TaxID=2627600 RepID=UPI001356E0B2|nr:MULTISPECIES: hypothetical protein [unclassified Raoultella]
MPHPTASANKSALPNLPQNVPGTLLPVRLETQHSNFPTIKIAAEKTSSNGIAT